MSLISLVLGRRLASDEQKETKIGVMAGVAAMGLDGLSSSAYGPEAALMILLPLGAAGPRYVVPITGLILVLLAMLYFSYRQTIEAYPSNGGSYTVAKENLGVWPSLLAAAALIIDYVLNVAVGISAGVGALVSAVPSVHKYTLPLCLIILALITLMNLRGTGDAGRAFALPTYFFITSLGGVLIFGLVKAMFGGGHPHPVVAPPALPRATAGVGLWLLLRSFASGCTAMTGVEAVSNGVSAFKDPPVRHAHRTLTVIVVVLAVLLGAIAYLCNAYSITAMNQDSAAYQSVLSQLTAAVIGRNWFYYVTIAGILAVLCLSANTSFVDFPRLCRLVATDNFLPHAFASAGRRLVYSVGILFLGGSAALLLVIFGGITDRLIPLFAVGAFLAFTLSQSGMVIHWVKNLHVPSPSKSDAPARSRGGVRVRLVANGLGAVGTAVALAIILAAKFLEGAWITVLAIPSIVMVFTFIHRYYRKIEAQTAMHGPLNLGNAGPPVALIPSKGWNRPTADALRLAMWLSPDVVAVRLSNLEGDDSDRAEQQIRQEWSRNVEAPARKARVPAPRLVMAQCPYRQFLQPVLKEIEALHHEFPDRIVAVIMPEVVEMHWWQRFLHRRRARRLRAALFERGDKRIVFIAIPWYPAE